MLPDTPGIDPISQPVSSPASSAAADEQSAVRSLVTVITFLLIFIMAARTPLDTDLWWHLSAGREMLRTGHLLNTDIFSFTRLGAHWVNPYWLGDVLSAWLFQQGGFLALGGMTTLLVLLSMGLVFLQGEGPVFLKSAALLLGGVVASVVWTPRPHLYSLVLLAAVGYVLYLYKYRGKDRLWVLPLLFIFWSNVHGGYPLGIILIGCLLAGEGVNHLLKIPGENTLSWAKMIRLGGWAVVCGLAVLINPNGFDIWRLPFQTVNMQVLQQFIPEWSSPDFHQVLEQSLLWLLLGLFAAVGLSGKTMDAGDLITTIVFTYMALLAKRNYGPFALVAVPVFVRYASAAIQTWRMRAPWLDRLTVRQAGTLSTGAVRLKKLINISLVVLLALVAFGKLYVVSHPALVGHYLRQGYPLAAVDWVNQNRPASRVLNEYHWGGFLQWAMPASKIFVDGRTDLYGDEVVEEWIQAVQGDANWQSILTRHEVNLVMLEPDRPLAQALAQAGWAPVYQDTQVVVYEKQPHD